MANQKPDNSTENRKAKNYLKQGRQLGGIANRIIASIDPTYHDRKILSEQDAKIQAAIDRQLDIVRGVSNTQVVDIIASIRNNPGKRKLHPTGGTPADAQELFTQNVGDIYGYFQDVYKNRYLEVDDLKFISKFIPSIGEGVRMYLDIIVASDDIKQTITRNIIIPGDIDNATSKEIRRFIEALEKEHSLLKKLKIAYKKALITGTFYAYHISYRELFETYSKGLKKSQRNKTAFQNQGISEQKPDTHEAPFGMQDMQHTPKGKKNNVLNIASESFTNFYGNGTPLTEMEPGLEGFGPEIPHLVQDGFITKCDYSASMESTFANIRNTLMSDMPATPASTEPEVIGLYARNHKRAGSKLDDLMTSLEADLPQVYFANTDVPVGILNDVVSVAQEGYNDFFTSSKAVEDLYKKQKKSGNPGFQDVPMADGTYGYKSHGGGDFSSIKGTYIKWIDYKAMVPIEILGRTIGYYHILTTTKKKSKSPKNGSDKLGSVISSSSMALFTDVGASEKRKEEVIQGIVDTISNAILEQFNARFVRKNASFRKIIAECIIANGLVDNDYMIQFIPAEKVVVFKVNLDDEDRGQSILTDSLFPAHQLLSITACKMLNYINKGGSKTIAHISSGKVNRNNTNQVNRVIRDIQAANVTFTDLLSSGAVFSKIARDTNMAMPKDQQGNRLIEFEVQDGQQVDWNTEYEQMLERWCLLGMGVPNSIIDVIGNVDIAKKVVSDNILMAGRAASLQADLEEPTTELYRAIIADSDMDDLLKSRASLMEFSLPRPKILQNQNNGDAINTAYSNAQAIANVYIGEDASEEEDMALKREFITLQVKKDLPYIDWAERDSLFEQAKVNCRKKEAEKTYQIGERGKIDIDPDSADGDGAGGEATDTSLTDGIDENMGESPEGGGENEGGNDLTDGIDENMGEAPTGEGEEGEGDKYEASPDEPAVAPPDDTSGEGLDLTGLDL